jgi:N-glycosylase/DNA lyase
MLSVTPAPTFISDPLSSWTRLEVDAGGVSLSDTLLAGQTFCWRYNPAAQTWLGWIGGHPVELRQQGGRIIARAPRGFSRKSLLHYFRLDGSWEPVAAALEAIDDPILQEAMRTVPGLRCVREPIWECTANFICSSLKQIPHIMAINQSLRRSFGRPDAVSGLYSFPDPAQLHAAGEPALRACQLGFRAKHLSKTSAQLASGEFDFRSLDKLPTPEAALALTRLGGVGTKVAHCILIYAGDRFDAFPIDVWIERLMRQLYWKKRRAPKRAEIEALGRERFGPLQGLAQHYLFHWYRLRHSPGHASKVAALRS